MKLTGYMLKLFGVCFVLYAGLWALSIAFPPPQGGFVAISPVAQAHHILDGPPRFYSTIEKQRIMRDEGFYKGPIDGLRGTLTIDAEIEHAKLYNNWCANNSGQIAHPPGGNN